MDLKEFKLWKDEKYCLEAVKEDGDALSSANPGTPQQNVSEGVGSSDTLGTKY